MGGSGGRVKGGRAAGEEAWWRPARDQWAHEKIILIIRGIVRILEHFLYGYVKESIPISHINRENFSFISGSM